jgi:cephalosporin-C deacetylase
VSGLPRLADFDLPVAELRAFRPEREEQADFDAFWESTLAEAAEHPLEVTLERVAPHMTAFDAFDMTFRGYGGDPIHAWLIHAPGESALRPCVVQFLGYTAGRQNVHERLAWAAAGYVTLVVETRGQGGPWQAGVTPDPHHADPHLPGILTKGIRSPQTYVYRRVYTDAARAVQAAASLPQVDPNRIAAAGRSQGAGIAIAAAALSGVAALIADVPFLCHFRRAIRITPEPPYSEIAQYLRINRSEVDSVQRTLSYFDGMNFAARCSAPALFSAALMDPICPPSTVFAAYNHYAGPRQMQVWRFNGHESGEGEQLDHELDFLATTLRHPQP